MLVLFRDDYNAERNSIVRSNAAMLGDAGVISIVSTVPATAEVALVHNGVVSSGPVTYVQGDLIAVEARASSNFVDAVQVELNCNGQTAYYALVTENDEALYVNPTMAGVDVFDIDHDEDGFGFNTSAALNALQRFDDNGQLMARISISGAIADAFTASESAILVPSFYNRQVHVIDAATDTHIGTIETIGRPRAAKWIHRPDSSIKDIWVASHSTGTIEVYSSTGELRFTLPVGNKPCGITTDGSTVYVSCNGDNKIAILRANGNSWLQTDAYVGQGPTDITMFNSRAYVSCTGGTSVCSTDALANQSTTFVGNNPRGLAVVGSLLHVALTEGDIVAINAQGEVVSSFRSGMSAFAVCNHNGQVYSTALSLRRIYRGESDIANVGQWPFFLYSDSHGLWCATMWSTNPSLLYKHNHNPHPFVIDVPYSVERDEALRTNTFAVVGINSQSYVSVIGHAAVLHRNGVAVGTQTVVDEGDELYMTLTSPGTPETEFSARLFVGDENNVYLSNTRSLDVTPDTFKFAPVLNAELNTTYTSDTITVVGLDDDVDVLATTSSGRLIVNGVEQATVSIRVKNGDTIAVKYTSAGEYSTPRFVTLTVGDQRAVFTLFTKASVGTTYLQRTRDAGKTIFDLINWPTVIVNELHNKLMVFNRADFTALETYSLLDTPSNSPRTDQPNIYALDVKRRRAYLVDVPGSQSNAAGVSKVYNLEGIPGGVTSGPSVSLDSVTSKSYISLYDLDAVKEMDGPTIPLRPGVKPMGLAVDNYNTMYVAGANGILALMEYRENLQSYRYKSALSLPGGGRLCEVLIDDANLFVSDLTLGAVHRLNSGMYVETVAVGLLPYSMTMSETHIYVANFGSATITVFAKVGGGINPRTIALPVPGSQPNAILYDPTTNRVYVSCSRNSMVYVLNAANNTFIESYPVDSLWGLSLYENKVIGLSLYGNLLQSADVGYARVGPGSLTFAEALNQELDAEVMSQTRSVNDMPQRETVYIDPMEGVTLFVNNVAVGSVANVSYLDNVRIGATSANTYNTTTSVGLYSYRHSASFNVTTIRDVYPNDIMFDTVQNIVPRTEVKSDTQVITGLDPTVSVPIHAEYTGDASRANLRLYVNDVEVEQPHAVKNDDELRIELHAYGLVMDGASVYVELLTDRDSVFGRWRIVSAFTNGAVHPPFKIEDTKAMDPDPSVHSQIGPELSGDRDSVPNYTSGTASTIGAEYDRNRYTLFALDLTYSPSLVARTVPIDGMLVQQNRSKAAVTTDAAEPSLVSYQQSTADIEKEFVAVPAYASAESSGAYSWESMRRASSVIDQAIGWNAARNDAMNAVETLWQEAHKYGVQWTPIWKLDTIRTQPTIAPTYGRNAVAAHHVDAIYLVADTNKGVYYNTTWRFNLDSLPVLASRSTVDMVNPQDRIIGTVWSRRLRSIPGTYKPLWDFSQTRSLVEVSTSMIHMRRAVMRYTAQQYDRARRRVDAELLVDYIGAITPSSIVFDAVASRRTRAQNRPTSQSYDVRKRITFDLYEYSAEDIRAFDTPTAAIAAGEASDHPIVDAFQMWDTYWMWDIPAQIERVSCASKSNEVNYVWGYIQGG